MIYNEIQQRGTMDFAAELYLIDSNHPKYEMAHHWHGDFEIIKIVSGSLKVKLNKREFDACEGDIIFVNSETVHGAAPENCFYECIVFSSDLIKATDSVCGGFLEALRDHVFVINDHFKKDNSEIYSAFLKFFDVMENKGSYFEAVGAIYSIFGIIIRDKLYKDSAGLSEGDSASNAKLKKVLSYMRSSYDTQITLEQMAMVAGMSPKYFCYFFKEMTKKSPVSYLNTYRVERAARKLLSTDMSVTDIAYSCGFNDLSYFIKTFKMIKGITPNTFRKNGE